jgi:nicotinamide-nucleotide amidase
MTVEVLNIGTELLLGSVVNTHSGWIAKRIFPLGLRISRQTTVPDGPAIRTAVLEACDRADILFITGGLGPTTDDITREVVAELLGRKLHPSGEIRARIEARLAARGYQLVERMLRQTMVPEGATVLNNENGTAPGLYFPAVSYASWSAPHFFLLPGPPRELQPMFDSQVLPILGKIARDLESKECRVYRVVGLGESAVEKLVGLELSQNPALEVGYCARPNEVDFRLIGAKADLDAIEPRVLEVLGSNLVSSAGEGIEEWLVAALAKRVQTVATAESCTGGLVASRITDAPGASEVFREGFVTYSNEAKSQLLGVPGELIDRLGAVSREVAIAMAEGAREKVRADYALSLTGIAGPGGGTPEKPVGLVFIALARPGAETLCRDYRFPADRATFKQLASQAALDLLRRELLGI